MMRYATVIVAIFLLGVSLTRADVPVPGRKTVLHELTFENLDEYPGYRFYLVSEQPLQPFAQGCLKVEAGQKLRPGDGYAFARWSVYLFAVPQEVVQKEGDSPKKEWFDGATSGVWKSEQAVNVAAGLPDSSPVAVINTRYRIDLKDGVLHLATTEEQPVDAAGRPVARSVPVSATNWIIPGIAVVAAVLAGVLALLSRRRCRT
jgi:hypothetical protein